MNETLPPINVVLIDTSATFLEAATRLLSTDPCIDVAGHVLTGSYALGDLKADRAQIVVVDIAVRPINGLDLVRRLKAAPEAPQVIVVAMFDDPEYRAAVREAGADGYLAKSQCGAALLPLIHALMGRQVAAPAGEHSACIARREPQPAGPELRDL